jgi:electron transfer flavoprotein alpha subunit
VLVAGQNAKAAADAAFRLTGVKRVLLADGDAFAATSPSRSRR